MWEFDEILTLNSPDKQQRESIVSRLLRIGAAWPEILADTAEVLEKRGAPYICCFAQLPYPVMVEDSTYAVESIEGVPFHLDFRPFALELDQDLRAKAIDVARAAPPLASFPIGTLVRGYIQLWGRRVNRYRNYQACFRADGVENLLIDPNLYGRKRSPAGYTGDATTSHAFETDLAKRFLPDFVVAIRRFLASYSIVTLEEVPLLEEVSGYFVMSAPGRVAYKELPIPIPVAMMRAHRSEIHNPVSRARMNQALAVGVREIDRYLRQLLAMHRVAKSGEPEIAFIGCAAAIEWYMNSLLPRAEKQLTIPLCLGKPPFRDLPKPLKKLLSRITKVRNDTVHGHPPERLLSSRELVNLRSRIASVRDAVEIGLRLYREMNLKKAVAATYEPSALS